MMNRELRFVLNDRDVSTKAPPGMLVLDYVRENRRLTGTKEGCKEGDCGACVVLVGVLVDGAVRYRPVTSCLMPLAELHGKHLVTIEGLNLKGLSRVQQAIVDEGASQCGFCTPGIVVSVTGHLMEHQAGIDAQGIKTALGGHLCRCTGYRSLKACVDHLDAPLPGKGSGVEVLVGQGELPAYFLEIPERLAALPPPPAMPLAARSLVVAGGTDLYVQQGDAVPSSGVLVLDSRPELKGIRETDTHVVLGPATTFEELAESEVFRSVVPGIRAYMDDIASIQIRNRATVGGNLINASPIGDVTILLLALDTTLTLTSPGGADRSVRLADFYRGYKQLDRDPDELLTRIRIGKPRPGTRINWEKVAKRRRLDIASVNSTLVARVEEGVVRETVLTCGGVGPTPMILRRASAALTGRVLSAETVEAAAALAQSEISPISDIRGSEAYKRLLVRQLVWAHFLTLYPEHITLEGLLEEH
jgi:xanthine dehydrogenase small subunit